MEIGLIVWKIIRFWNYKLVVMEPSFWKFLSHDKYFNHESWSAKNCFSFADIFGFNNLLHELKNPLIHFIHLTYVLTLKVPNKNCSWWLFNFLLLSLEENKAWLFIWICSSVETLSLIFLWKTMKQYLWMSSAAVLTGTLRIKLNLWKIFIYHCVYYVIYSQVCRFPAWY